MSEPALQHGTAAAAGSDDLRGFDRGAADGRALDGILARIGTRHGCAIVTGVVGTGKTTLARALAAACDRTVFAALLLNPALSRDALLRQVLRGYGVISDDDVQPGRSAGVSHEALGQALVRFVQGLASIGGHAVLVVDDAHRLPDEGLDAVVRLSRPSADGAPAIQLVLLGEPSLTDVLARGHADLLNRSDTERFALAPVAAAPAATPRQWLVPAIVAILVPAAAVAFVTGSNVAQPPLPGAPAVAAAPPARAIPVPEGLEIPFVPARRRFPPPVPAFGSETLWPVPDGAQADGPAGEPPAAPTPNAATPPAEATAP